MTRNSFSAAYGYFVAILTFQDSLKLFKSSENFDIQTIHLWVDNGPQHFRNREFMACAGI
jgi:hypothetical protein